MRILVDVDDGWYEGLRRLRLLDSSVGRWVRFLSYGLEKLLEGERTYQFVIHNGKVEFGQVDVQI